MSKNREITKRKKEKQDRKKNEWQQEADELKAVEQ